MIHHPSAWGLLSVSALIGNAFRGILVYYLAFVKIVGAVIFPKTPVVIARRR